MTEQISSVATLEAIPAAQAVGKEGRPNSVDAQFDAERRELIRALGRTSSLAPMVADTQQFDLRQACRIARVAMEDDPDFDKKLVELVRVGTITAPDQIIRVLAVLESTCSQSRLLSHVLGLNHLEGRIRSKLTLMVGRLTHNPVWLRENLADANPRVRANAIEGLWDVHAEGLEDILRSALRDPNHRVVSNAALALYKLGDPSIVATFHSLLRHEDAMFRRAALWAVGQTRDPRFEPDVSVRLLAAEDEELATARKVSAELATSRAISQFTSRLSLEVLSDQLSPSGDRTVRLTCVPVPSATWLGSRSLSGVNFIVADGGKQLEDYRFRWVEPAEPFVALLVLPNGWNGKADLLQTALSDRGQRESFGFLPFQTSAPSNQRSEAEEKIEVRFEVGTKISSEYLERRNQVAKTLEQAIITGLRELRTKPGERHLFVVLDPSIGSTESLAPFPVDNSHGAKVHVVAWNRTKPGVTNSLQKLVKGTGGRFVEAETVSDFTRTLIALRASHFGAFELAWKQPKNPHSQNATIVCRGDFGYGEVTTALAAHS